MSESKVGSLLVEKGRRQIHQHAGGTTIDGPDGIALYRLLTIKMGLKLEMSGIRLTSARKAPSCYTIIRKEFGIRGRDKAKAYSEFCAMHGLEE